MPSIYLPKEDSYLMSEALKQKIPFLLTKNPNLKFLEIGSGSGINLQTALNIGIKKENIFSSDINPFSVKHCKNLGFQCVESDLFEKIPKQKFDIVAFNPPYLPLDKNEPKSSQISTTGGKKGNEITINFLKQAKKYLSKEGIIFLITSSLSEKTEFNNFGYKYKELFSKSLFFEKLYLFEIKHIR